MTRRSADLSPSPAGPAVTLAEVARRAGVSVAELTAIFRRESLEQTFSIEEVCARWGCERTQVHQLINLGKEHGNRLHPTRGGLSPTFKPSHKSRRIPLSAIERHEAHMARVHDHVEIRRSA